MKTTMGRRISALEKARGGGPVRRVFVFGDAPEPEGLGEGGEAVELVRVVWKGSAAGAEGVGDEQ